ncbi:Tyrosine 3-monooxygenase [Trachymyrmex cornetzi]|uniref:Tyrosine 3-monooxygenase n=1 Tax=Trachymyrmex cornetzi TaxID=471704 RepID=A0A195E9H4_9HYME|nr:Tyrosine 3-monooxygenase [Trachymyrmex cornetzi]
MIFYINRTFNLYFQNGYPARRRSLVDDARFETLVVKQTKQSVLEEARQRANERSNICICMHMLMHDVFLCYRIDTNADQTITCTKDKGQEENYIDISSSDDEQVESLVCAVQEEEAKAEASSDSDGKPDDDDDDDDVRFFTDAGLTEEEVVLAKTIAESPDSEYNVQKAALVLRLREGIGSLGRILKTIENFKGMITHVESRPSKKEGLQFEVLVKIDMSRQSLLQLIRNLRQSSALDGVNLLADNSVSIKDPWFPRHASDLDNCNHLMTKYEPDLDMNHPGFADKEYRARRKVIAEIAFAYKYGDPIPSIPYTETENETWSRVFNTVLDLVPKHACMEYQRVFKKLQEERIFESHRIPQLQEVSDFLKKSTGFTLRPAAGLLTARDFLSSLAFRIFQSTQYVRHINSPYHTPEPDCIHELLGHMPLLADPSFAQFSQEIGLASLGASDEEIEKLSTIYWFTVEFGLCKEGPEVKAYGAGLLSAYGELLHALSDKCEHRAFDPSITALQKYQDQEYQPIYYVAESFEDAKEKFRRWVATMSRPFEVRFNPHTQRVEVLDSVDRLEGMISQLNTEMTHLTNAVNKMKARQFAACCILIDTVANGLKFALNIDEIKHEKIKARYENETKELRIQELYRNIYEEDTRNSQKCINKTNLDNDNHKSIRKHKSKKFRTKHTIGGKHERHRHNRHHRNAINNMLPESNAMITAPQQITIIDEKCKKDNVIVLQDTILKTKCTISADKLKKNIDSQQENSLNKKADSSAISEIIDKSDTKHKLMKFKTSSQKQENLSNIDTNKKMQTKQNFDCMKHEEVAILSRRQSSKDCVTIVINKQMDSRYEKLFAKRHDGLRKKNHRLPHDVKSFTHDCCENSSITNNRVKPVLLRVVNWFFSGCPEASKRHREQINEVGKEEIFESTNTWLL